MKDGGSKPSTLKATAAIATSSCDVLRATDPDATSTSSPFNQIGTPPPSRHVVERGHPDLGHGLTLPVLPVDVRRRIELYGGACLKDGEVDAAEIL